MLVGRLCAFWCLCLNTTISLVSDKIFILNTDPKNKNNFFLHLVELDFQHILTSLDLLFVATCITESYKYQTKVSSDDELLHI